MSTTMENPHNLPAHLIGMTQAKWDALPAARREAMLDRSALHPKLAGLEGKKVRVAPKREYGASVFLVGRSTGWRPVHLAMRAGDVRSGDIVRVDEFFETVTVLAR